MNRSRVLGAAAAGAALAAGAAGCSAEPEGPQLSVVQPYIPRPAAEDVAAGYLTVRNSGDAADRLVGVTAGRGAEVTVHRSSASGMREVGGLEVPAGGELKLSRGGNHLMLEGLASRLSVGDTLAVTLRFAESEPIRVRLPVKPLTYRPPAER